MSLHAQHSISSAFCMYGSELLGGGGGCNPLNPPSLDPLLGFNIVPVEKHMHDWSDIIKLIHLALIMLQLPLIVSQQ